MRWFYGKENLNFADDIDVLFKTCKSLLLLGREADGKLREKFRLDWNFHSNRIQGNTLIDKEIRDLIPGTLPPEKPRRFVKERHAHDLALSIERDVVDRFTSQIGRSVLHIVKTYQEKAAR